MKTTPEELHKIKAVYQSDFKNKIYMISSRAHYSGTAFVYAKNAEDANKQIDEFKAIDSSNKSDSWGYSHVDESDFTGELTDEPNQVTVGIYYSG